MGASEVERAESRDRDSLPRQHTEECRLEAAGHCRRAREAGPKKGIRRRAAGPGTGGRAPSDRTLRHSRAGRVTQEGAGERRGLDAAGRRMREPGGRERVPKRGGGPPRQGPLAGDGYRLMPAEGASHGVSMTARAGGERARLPRMARGRRR